MVSQARPAVRLLWGGWLVGSAWLVLLLARRGSAFDLHLVLDKACPVAGGMRDDVGRDCDGREGWGLFFISPLFLDSGTGSIVL